jgi:hypothetical protein
MAQTRIRGELSGERVCALNPVRAYADESLRER